MAARGAVALSSSFPADATLAGRPRSHSTGVHTDGGWNGDQRSVRTNLQVNASRVITSSGPLSTRTTWQCFEVSRSATSGRNSIDKKLQGFFAAPKAKYSSHGVATVEDSPELPKGKQLIFDRSSSDGNTVSQKPHLQGVQAPAANEPHPYQGVAIGDSWREIQGETNWKGMLDQLDPRLRSELVRYGEFTQATYDSFNFNEFSRYCGCCKFRKAEFFETLGLKNRGYEIVEYLYSTSNDVHLPNFFKTSKVEEDEKWSKASNWAGYVAVCTSPEEIKRMGRRDILIAWRGTVTALEWLDDCDASPIPTGPENNSAEKKSSKFGCVDVKVERGFKSLYESKNEDSTHNKTSSKDQVRHALKRLMEAFKDDEMSITITGHSLGGALATLCAYDIADAGLNVVHSPSSDNHAGEEPKSHRIPITVFAFASPRVGNTAFKDRLEHLGVKVLRVVNIHDLVPHVPGLLFRKQLEFVWAHVPWLVRNLQMVRFIQWVLDFSPATYSHVGLALEVDNLQSSYIRPTLSPGITHNLELYLHLVTGSLGMKLGGFCQDLAKSRDLTLVNKSASLLTKEHNIPGTWFQEENKGLVRSGDRFIYRHLLSEDFPEQAPQHSLDQLLTG